MLVGIELPVESQSASPGDAYVKIVPMLVLASSSPRRQQLLTLLGIDFRIKPAEVDERILTDEKPEQYVLRLAHNKVMSIAPDLPAHRIVIAADTAVVDGDQILGKPENAEQASQMLRHLRGRCHYVYTGLAARDGNSERVISELCVTEVHMRQYKDIEIADYVASGDPLDKAGAYAIQNRGFNPVEELNGCYANVVGLPLCHLVEMLTKFQIHITNDITIGCRTTKGYKCRLGKVIADLNYQ